MTVSNLLGFFKEKDSESLLALLESISPMANQRQEFDLFRIFGVMHLERFHQRMIAALLDPRETHGLGDRVLAGLMRHVGVEVPVEDIISDIQTEYPLGKHGRIDILVTAGKRKMGIELKVGTLERPGQTSDYAKALGSDATLIFLTPHGTPPQSNDARAMNFNELANIISDAIDRSKKQHKETGLAFHIARSYVSICRALASSGEFVQPIDKNEFEQILAHRGQLKRILNLSSEIQTARLHVINGFWIRVKEALHTKLAARALRWVVQIDDDLLEQRASLGILPSKSTHRSDSWPLGSVVIRCLSGNNEPPHWGVHFGEHGAGYYEAHNLTREIEKCIETIKKNRDNSSLFTSLTWHPGSEWWLGGWAWWRPADFGGPAKIDLGSGDVIDRLAKAVSEHELGEKGLVEDTADMLLALFDCANEPIEALRRAADSNPQARTI